MPQSRSKKAVTKLLDAAWSRAVKKKAGFKCEVCGVKKSLNSHHYISRNNRRLRWDLRNGICACAGCHTFRNESFHHNPVFAHFWMEENRWEDLQFLACHQNEIKKWTLEEMEATLEELNNFIK